MGLGLDGGFDGEATSLESTLDRATERYALALRRQLHETDGGDQTAALALVKAPVFHVGQLRWKGIEVSDEFLRYAARVARGEQLAPYRGPVLARSSGEFPWNATLRAYADGQTQPTERRLRRRKRSKWLLGWARGAGALGLCMLLVGVGAAAVTGGEPEEDRPVWTSPPVATAPSAAQPPAELAPIATSTAERAAPHAEPTSNAVARLAPQAPRRSTLTAVTARRGTSITPNPQPATELPAPVEIAPPAPATRAEQEPAVMTIVGSTLLPPLEESLPAPADSALLIETPSF